MSSMLEPDMMWTGATNFVDSVGKFTMSNESDETKKVIFIVHILLR